jgi:hypothetical protein
MSILTEDALEYLNQGISDLEAYVNAKIESEVVLTKHYNS